VGRSACAARKCGGHRLLATKGRRARVTFQ
jgi:hypothetical protein